MSDDELARILDGVSERVARRRRLPALVIAGTGVTVVAVTVALALNAPVRQHVTTGAFGPRLTTGTTGLADGLGASPQAMELTAYTDCHVMLDQLRSHAAANITSYSGYSGYGYAYRDGVTNLMAPVPMSMPAGVADGAMTTNGAAGSTTSTDPQHSTTNDQEIGVDEPDIVKTDGHRIVTITGGVLHVIDAASHQLTGSLDLTMYAGASDAQLLMSGDRVLVVLGGASSYGGIVHPGMGIMSPAFPYQGTAASSTFLLIDLSGAPRVLGTLHVTGSYVDARMINGVARLVVQSTPNIVVPQPPVNLPNAGSGIATGVAGVASPAVGAPVVAGSPSAPATASGGTSTAQAAVAATPLAAWQPSYQIATGEATTTGTVPCGEVSHPTKYTGMQLLTVYTVDLAAGLDDPKPVTLAADAGAVYASGGSLYIASYDGTSTQLHRYAITGSDRPHYLGSGTVPGALLDSYSMSEYAGALRLVTTSNSNAGNSTSLYVLDADTLTTTGRVDGLGANENLHAVRFLGPLAYVVTYQSVDPLYVLDLSDPHHPRMAGKLTVTGYSDYLHPVAAGRLLGVGESVNSSELVTGLQLSLFDVGNPSNPTRLDRVVRDHTPSETPIDPHAFLFWPTTGTAVVPIDSWDASQSGAALVVHVGANSLRVVGTVRNPAVVGVDGYAATGIERTLVIGNELWTMSSAGLQASDLQTLNSRAWVAFA
jgi:uncharacterized secreted protein with C-terminal beta-propeller domain